MRARREVSVRGREKGEEGENQKEDKGEKREIERKRRKDDQRKRGRGEKSHGIEPRGAAHQRGPFDETPVARRWPTRHPKSASPVESNHTSRTMLTIFFAWKTQAEVKLRT